MKKLSILLSILCLIPSISFGRIGETKEQCIARYGDTSYTNSAGDLIFSKNGFSIMASLLNGKVGGILYRKPKVENAIEKDEELSDKEINTLLTANYSSSEWVLIKEVPFGKVWVTKDRKMWAIYHGGMVERQLMIYTDEMDEFIKEKNRKEKADALKGM